MLNNENMGSANIPAHRFKKTAAIFSAPESFAPAKSTALSKFCLVENIYCLHQLDDLAKSSRFSSC